MSPALNCFHHFQIGLLLSDWCSHTVLLINLSLIYFYSYLCYHSCPYITVIHNINSKDLKLSGVIVLYAVVVFTFLKSFFCTSYFCCLYLFLFLLILVTTNLFILTVVLFLFICYSILFFLIHFPSLTHSAQIYFKFYITNSISSAELSLLIQITYTI